MPKESVFTVKLESELHEAFMSEAQSVHRPASQIVRDLMRDFVQRQREAREHDAWFRAKVKEALDNPDPGMPHDAALDEARAIVDRIAAEKAKT
jgi:predicted transcriptional regulator